MSITWSKGYDGTIGEADLATWSRGLGLDYAVEGPGDWKVTAVPASARTVAIAAGTGSGRGFTDRSNGSGDQVALPNPASGQLWHVVAAHRDISGAGGATTFGYGPGAADPWAAIAARARFETTAGDNDDQPLALVRVAKDVSTIQQIIDLRCWQANGGAVGASDYVRGYLDGPGTQLTIGTDQWTRAVTESGLAEWVRTPLLRPVNVLAAGSPLSGTLPADAPVYEQAGTFAGITDGSGYQQLAFPVAFPNGLLTVSLTNGDGSAVPAAVIEIAGTPWDTGTRTRVVYRVWAPSGSGMAPAANRLHRVNWSAKGW